MIHNLDEFLEVKDSLIEGRGLFTKVLIPEGTVFFEITGEIISEAECVRREEEEDNVYIFWNDDHYIDASRSEKIKYINHNCGANCEVVDNEDRKLYLYALRDIHPREELTINYGYDEIYEICNCDECTDENQTPVDPSAA